MNRELLVANCKGDDWKLIRGGVGREDVALLVAIILGAWDFVVDGLAGCVVNKSKRSTSVSNSCIARAINGLSIDTSGY